jgi:hypothetical protein
MTERRGLDLKHVIARFKGSSLFEFVTRGLVASTPSEHMEGATITPHHHVRAPAARVHSVKPGRTLLTAHRASAGDYCRT